jgi:NAD+ synthase
MRVLNYQKVEEYLVRFIKEEFDKAGFSKAVIGVSGGVDSSLVAALAVTALGKENVHGILMPYNKIKASVETDVTDGIDICEHLGISYHIQDITSMVDACSDMMSNNTPNAIYGENYKMRKANIMARMRMVTLFDNSHANKALVLGTENLTESSSTEIYVNDQGVKTCVGKGGFAFFTMFGDAASCIEVLNNLYKLEVFELARYLKLPQFIIDKKPSARLFEDHTDEGELGISYADADPILYHINEQGWLRQDFTATGYNMEHVEKVFELKKKGAFKSNIPNNSPEYLITDSIIKDKNAK